MLRVIPPPPPQAHSLDTRRAAPPESAHRHRCRARPWVLPGSLRYRTRWFLRWDRPADRGRSFHCRCRDVPSRTRARVAGAMTLDDPADVGAVQVKGVGGFHGLGWPVLRMIPGISGSAIADLSPGSECTLAGSTKASTKAPARIAKSRCNGRTFNERIDHS